MQSSIITEPRFERVIASVPDDGDAIGLDREGVYYIVKKEKSGVRKGKPYTNPARIQISDDHQRFWIARIEDGLRLTYDPNGGFDPVPIVERSDVRKLERFFERLEGYLQIVQHKRQAASSVRPDLDVADLNPFLRLAFPWCAESRRRGIIRAVRSAVTDPQQYVRDHQARLTRRGIHQPTQHLHVIALVDALQAIGAAAEIDWNAGDQMIYGRISQLTAPFGIPIEPINDGSNLPTLKILQRLGRHLSTKGYDLATIDIDSDAYVLIVVPAPASRDIKALAAKMDVEIHRP